jgi:membrane protein insertase Oxa1/YidC/SpoIIIJ
MMVEHEIEKNSNKSKATMAEVELKGTTAAQREKFKEKKEKQSQLNNRYTVYNIRPLKGCKSTNIPSTN